MVPTTALSAPDKAAVHKTIADGAAWLLAQQQDDGSFFPGDQFKLGISSLVTIGLFEAGVPTNDPAMVKAVDYIFSHNQENGGIYDPNEGLGNYNTSLALLVLAAGKIARPEVVARAHAYLIGLQNTDGGITDGGIGYGSRGSGNEDLSNTSMAVEALAATGLPSDHPAMQRALAFVQRCQNLSSHNNMEWAGNDGGAAYSPDSSKSGGSYSDGYEGSKPKEGGQGGATKLSSYGSMTYALLKSYVYLGLTADDPRLQAALDWCSKNYQFEVNPGMKAKQEREGLFYFYQAMAKTYELLGKKQLNINGQTVDWRSDLYQAIVDRAQSTPEGHLFWINDMKRWGEGLPHLTTAYMLVSLNSIARTLD